MVCENINDAENQRNTARDALLETRGCSGQGSLYTFFVLDASFPVNEH